VDTVGSAQTVVPAGGSPWFDGETSGKTQAPQLWLHGHLRARSETAWSGDWKHLEHRATDRALTVTMSRSFGRGPVKPALIRSPIDFR